MPIYTFRCPKCQDKFTDIFPMRDSNGENVVCPKCKSKGVKRVYEGSFSIGTKSKAPSCSSGVCPIR